MKKVLVALDDSEHSRKVTEEASELAACLDAEVTLLTVMEDFSRISGLGEVPLEDMKRLNEERKESLEQFLQKEAEQFRKKGAEVKVRLAEGRHPGQTICDIAHEEDYSFIVLGSRGMSGLAKVFLGSVSNWVTQCAERNVIIVK